MDGNYGEDEDVVFNFTELGKYWASSDVTGAVPYQIFPGQPHYVRTYPEPDESFENEPPPNFAVMEMIDSELSSDEDESLSWCKLGVQQNYFTREHRLLRNSRYLLGKSEELRSVLEKLEEEAQGLEEAEEVSRCEIISNLKKLKLELHAKLAVFQNLISVEDLLLEQLTSVVKTDVVPVETLTEEPRDLSKCQVEIDTLEPLWTQDSSIFETHSCIGESSQNDENAARDEIFEATEEVIAETTGEDSTLLVDTVEKEFQCTQRIVLDELKTILRPRRADMLNREIEAYTRAYGTAPELLDEDFVKIRMKDVVVGETKDNETNIFPNAKTSIKDDNAFSDSEDDAIDYCVIDDRSATSTVSIFGRQRPAFFDILQNTLEGRRGNILGGIVPIYKRDEDQSSPGSSEGEQLF